jgi:serine/threonine protein kinase
MSTSLRSASTRSSMSLATDEGAHPAEPAFGAPNGLVHRLGTVVAGAFRLVRHIGSGGSGHVFECEHVRLGRRFAIKLLRSELDAERSAAQRFRREARAMARIHSEHVVGVIDCGELEDRTPYLVMELLRGEDLRSVLNREGRLPSRRAVPLLIQACRGMSAVHAADLVHRDLKPENLFVTKRDTGRDFCKVLDFGVAQMKASLATHPGIILGTVRYMAPEQLSSSATIGPAVDVYALGAILYECLAGRPAHSGQTVQQVMYAIMNEEREQLGQLVPGLPAALGEVVTRALRKDPSSRPHSVDELAAMLQEAMPARRDRARSNETTTLPNSSVTNRLPVAATSGKFRHLALVAASTILAAAAGWAIGQRDHTPTAPPLMKPRLAEKVAQVAGSKVSEADSVGEVVSSPPVTPSRSAPSISAAPLKPSRSPAFGSRPPTERLRAGVAELDLSNPYGE